MPVRVGIEAVDQDRVPLRAQGETATSDRNGGLVGSSDGVVRSFCMLSPSAWVDRYPARAVGTGSEAEGGPPLNASLGNREALRALILVEGATRPGVVCDVNGGELRRCLRR